MKPIENLQHLWNRILCQHGLSMKRGLCQRKLSYAGRSNTLVWLEGKISTRTTLQELHRGVLVLERGRRADTFRYGIEDLWFMKGKKARPKLTQRRYTAWLPAKSDHVTKHDMRLANIAELMWQGYSTPEIAERLGLDARSTRRNVAWLERFPEMTVFEGTFRAVWEGEYAAD